MGKGATRTTDTVRRVMLRSMPRWLASGLLHADRVAQAKLRSWLTFILRQAPVFAVRSARHSPATSAVKGSDSCCAQ
jgi:hypothetical protein